jgi:hypothetical protein
MGLYDYQLDDSAITNGFDARPQQQIQQPPPQQQQPMGQQPIFANRPQQQARGMQGAINSPYAAMANQGMNNMSALRRGQVPNTSPTQAYQQQIVAQATANQQKKINDLKIQGAEQNLDSFYKYKQFQKEFPDQAEGMSYQDFQRINLRGIDSTSQIKNLERLQQLNPNLSDEDAIQFFEDAVRAPKVFQLGGGGVAQTGGPAGQRTLVEPSQGTARNVNEAGLTTRAQETEKTNAGQVREALTGSSQARTAYDLSKQLKGVTQEYIDKFEGPTPPDTGFIPGMMANVFGVGTEALGDMSAQTIEAAMQNLGLANLAPVTEQEFAAVMRLWADISNSEELNLGSLKNALKRTERLQSLINNDLIYNAGLMEEYGSKGQNAAYLRSNPMVRDLMKTEEEVDF